MSWGRQRRFEEKRATALLLKITQKAPGLIDVAPKLLRPLAVILGRMMARRLEDRYQDVRVIVDDLKSYLHRGLLAACDGERPTSEPTPSDPPDDLTRVYLPTP